MKTDWKDAEGTAVEVDTIQGRYGAHWSVVFTYKVDDHWYGGTFTSYETEYKQGDPVYLRYDPVNPERNNLVQSETRRKWFITAGVAAFGLLLLYFAIR